jgi:hypothetical protein
MKKLILFSFIFLGFILVSCSKDDANEPMLIVKFKFDKNQIRLNNLGQPSTIPSGNAAQSPNFNSISAHYIEFAPTANTQLGNGVIVYHAPETNVGGSAAIDFDQSKIVSEGETFLKIPLSQLNAGTYEWLRVSLSYQNYEIDIRSNNLDYTGTLASFVGFNTYISSFNIGNNFFNINANKLQGFWAFGLNNQPIQASGQAPANATTVPNPIAATSPIPAGSCVVTGKFPTNLIITGTEKNDVVVTVSLSINNSFEWNDVIPDGKFEPTANENVVDMGLRGMIPTFIK